MTNNTMTNTQTDIENIVMRRVHLIRILRLVISTVVFALLTSGAALWEIGREVWVARIFENAPSNIANIPYFYMAAFIHTNIIVQVLTVLTLVSLLFLIRETARLLRDVLTSARTAH